jgi:hypothetical protein
MDYKLIKCGICTNVFSNWRNHCDHCGAAKIADSFFVDWGLVIPKQIVKGYDSWREVVEQIADRES